MGVFNDPRFITWKTVCEAKGFHIVAVETTQGEFIGGNNNAAIEILEKKKKKLECRITGRRQQRIIGGVCRFVSSSIIPIPITHQGDWREFSGRDSEQQEVQTSHGEHHPQENSPWHKDNH